MHEISLSHRYRIEAMDENSLANTSLINELQNTLTNFKPSNN
uniref:Uncharacterized protein n=1 Tax=Arundo donax TaxID=35708 RepID=A0A0A9H808_ARUDO